MHVWRGEYEHALSASGGKLDDAACLTMAGDVREALSALGESDDTLRRGLLAYKADLDSEAIDLLEYSQANPYLEFYRLYYRASALFRSGRYGEAVDSALLLIDNPICRPGHSLRSKANELLLQSIMLYDGALDSLDLFTEGMESLSNRSSLLLAKILLQAKGEAAAAPYFLIGIESPPDSLSEELYDELIGHFTENLSLFDLNEKLLMAQAATSRSLLREARSIIEEAEKKDPDDYRLELARGSMYRASGKKKRALRVLRDLFKSHASVDIKKEALLEIASIEYDLNRPESCADSHRLFGLYYPSDRRSASSLDLAARLYVSSGNYPDALETWSRLRERRSGKWVSIEAGLSESALRYMLGDSDIANSILKELLDRSDERHKAAILYWLARTSESQPESETWIKRLEMEYPVSFYALTSREGKGAFELRDAEIDNTSESIERLEQREREFVDLVCRDLEPGPALHQDAAYRALDYLLSRGFVAEASSCVEDLAVRFGSDSAAMAALYATVRSSGLIDLGLKLLWTKGLSSRPVAGEISLRYPIAFSASVLEAGALNRLPVEIIFAIIREESSFDRYAVSRAGALGLMQLMPRTGKWVGRKIDSEGYEREDLLIPRKNIAAGSWYMRYLLNRADDSIVAALASYNGGEGRMSKWRKTFTPADDPILAVELIGPKETRRYVKRVLDSMAAYQMLVSEEREGR
jgi:soluble lytic murein transglycosylase